VLSRTGRLAEAIGAVRAAIKLQPKRWDFHSQLGDLLLRSDKLRGAERSFRAAVRGDPDNAHFRVQLSRTLVRLERFEEARALAEEALGLEPANTGLQAYLLGFDRPEPAIAAGNRSPERQAVQCEQARGCPRLREVVWSYEWRNGN
jgi:Flp pilus assembly protein TadD